MTSASQVYAEQLFRLGHGYPLWDPEPATHPDIDGLDGEVHIGDVGFVDASTGTFHRLFNAILPADDDANKAGVPEGFKPFVQRSYGKVDKRGAIDARSLCSKAVKHTSANGQVSIQGAGGGIEFQCTDEQGAVLLLEEGADREALLPSRRMANYMRQNYNSWVMFAQDQLDVDISREDLFFVRGHVKTKKWAVVAWIHEGRSAKLSFDGNFSSLANASLKVTYSSDVTVPPERNWGPKQDVQKKIKGKSRGKAHQTRETHKTDQCVFLNYYKLRVRLGFWPTVMKAAAGSHDLSEGPDDDAYEGSAAAGAGDAMEDVVIEQVPAPQKVYDPVDILLDYILRHSDATVAIANDEELVELCKAKSQEFPDDIREFLETIQPPIEVNEDGLGMLSHEEIAPETSAQQSDAPRQPASDLVPQPPRAMEEEDTSRPKSGGVIVVSDEHTNGVCSLTYSPDGSWIASGSEDAKLTIWNAETGGYERTCERHNDTVCSLAFSPNSAEIVTGSRDGTAIIWTVSTGQPRAFLNGHRGFVYSVAWSPDGTTIATASVDFTVRIWEAATATERSVIEGHNAIVMLVAYSPDSLRIASASADYSARVWNVADGTQVSVLEGHSGIIYSLAFSPDNRRVVTGSDDGTARIWLAESGAELVTLREHAGSVWAAAFSPDGKQVLSAASDGTVKICDSFSGDLLHTLEGGDALVNAAAFSPEGSRICASFGDNVVRVWDARTGRILGQLAGHSDKVSHLRFSPQGDKIVSSSDDSSLRIWDLNRLLSMV